MGEEEEGAEKGRQCQSRAYVYKNKYTFHHYFQKQS